MRKDYNDKIMRPSIKGLRLLILFATYISMVKKKDIIQVSNERKAHDLCAASSFVLPLVRQILGKKGFVETDILSNWGEIVGEELAEFVVPQAIDFRRGERTNGVLKVMVQSGAFALELQHREKYVIRKINDYFGYKAVSSLKIIQNAGMDFEKKQTRVESVQKNLVTKEEEFYIKDLSAGIKNNQLQETVERLGRSIISNNKGEDKK